MKFIFGNVACLGRLGAFFVRLIFWWCSNTSGGEWCLRAMDWQADPCHSLCDPVLHLIPLKQLSSCSTSLCLTGHTTHCYFWVSSLLLCFPEPCQGCKASISSQCLSETSCVFQVTVPFPLPLDCVGSSVAFANGCTKEKGSWTGGNACVRMACGRGNARGQGEMLVAGETLMAGWLWAGRVTAVRARGWGRKSISC